MKKLFNNVIMRMMLCAGVIVAVGCQEYGIDSQPEVAPNIQDDALESYAAAAESAASIVFNISANTPWRIDRDVEWITVTPSMSAVSSLVSEVSVIVADNDTYNPRTAALTITAPEVDGYSKTITIVQASKGDFVVTEASDVAAEGGEAVFYIFTNKAWEYVPVTDYLYGAANITSAEDTDDVQTYELKIKVPANPGIERMASFILRTAAGDRECSFKQIGIELRLDDSVFDEGIADADGVISVPAPGETLTIPIRTNVDYDVDVPADLMEWADIVVNKAASTISISTSGYNPYFKRREGVIKVAAKGISGISPVEIPIAQDVAYTLDELVVVNEDGSATLNAATLLENKVVNAIKAKYSHILGKWTINIDNTKGGYSTAHYNIIIDDAATGQPPFYKVWMTPDVSHSGETAGFNNNCMQISNDAATWNAPAPAQRRNFDKSINGTNLVPAESQYWWTDVCNITKVTLISEITEGTGVAGDKIMHSTEVTFADGRVVKEGITTTLGADVASLESKGVFRISAITHASADDALVIKSIKYEPIQ